jgi:hypothetical protein
MFINGGILQSITWACKKQYAIYISLAKEEYRAMVNASQEALWIQQILSYFGFQHQHLTTLWCENKSAIKIAKDPIQHQHNKHIELHMYFIKKILQAHVLKVI